MQQYELGKPYPHNNSANGQEKAVISFNEGFFDVLIYLQASSKDIEAFRKGKIRYGYFLPESTETPFFLIQFLESFAFDAPMNFLKTQEQKQEEWLNADANSIQLFLIDANTNVIIAMRLIGVRPNFSEEIRDILERQLQKYATSQEVDKLIIETEALYDNDKMLKNSKMILL